MISCDICGSSVESEEVAIRKGWEPSYWLDETTVRHRPVCGGCSATYLTDHASDPIVKSEKAEEVRIALKL